MSDDPYKAPQSETETREQSEFLVSRRLPASRLPTIWIGIGVLGLVAVALALSDGLPPDVIGLGIGLVLLLLSAVGLTLNWGGQ